MSKSDVFKNIQHTHMYVSKGCVMTAGKLEQYYKNNEEWTMQHIGNDLFNTMLTIHEFIWQYLHSNRTYTDYTAFFARHNKWLFHATQFSYCASSPACITWLCSWMYNSSGKMKAIFVRMKFFKPKNLSHSFIYQVR